MVFVRFMDLFICFEGLVLEVFVRVHGFVLRSFSAVSNASGCSRMCLQSRPDALPMGGGPLSRSARVGWDPGQQLGASVRSAGSSRWGIVETALSTIIFGYATKGTVDSLCGQDIEVSPGELARSWLLFPPVLLCIGCTICTGMSHLVCSVRSQGAVNSITSANAYFEV